MRGPRHRVWGGGLGGAWGGCTQGAVPRPMSHPGPPSGDGDGTPSSPAQGLSRGSVRVECDPALPAVTVHSIVAIIRTTIWPASLNGLSVPYRCVVLGFKACKVFFFFFLFTFSLVPHPNPVLGDPRGPAMNRHPSLTAEPGVEPRSLGSKSSSLFFFLRGKKNYRRRRRSCQTF